MILNDTPNAASISSDESFTSHTTVANTLASTSVGDRDKAQLEADILAVRQRFDASMDDEASAYEQAEKTYAGLIAEGYANALQLLAHKPILRPLLSGVGMTGATDDTTLLGQIAKLQLGRWKSSKAGANVWHVPSRRDERLGRFYRIFFADPAKWPVKGMADAIFAFKGKSTGILNAAKGKKETVSKREKAENLKAAKKARTMGEAKLPGVNVGKQGEYQLILPKLFSHLERWRRERCGKPRRVVEWMTA